MQFRALSKALEQGDMPDDVERADEQLREKSGQFIDLSQDRPEDIDMDLHDDVLAEPVPLILTQRADPARSVDVFTVLKPIGKHELPACLHMVHCMRVKLQTWFMT